MARFISFAQNREDVMLWRALAHVQDGFYIDVGASDPVDDSVTKAFYDRGWHGINIEPNPQAFEKLCTERPRDVNLPLALSDRAGHKDFFIVQDDPRLSTLNDDQARKHAEDGDNISNIVTETRMLREVCEDFSVETIHFLKIDVEGEESSVLRGADFQRWRPWIVVIEAIEPKSLAPNYHASEILLRSAGYHFVYFDGLNRFYIAREHLEALKGAFDFPPNVRDGYVQSDSAIAMQLREIQAEHEQVAGDLHMRNSHLQAELRQCIVDREKIVNELQAQISALGTKLDAAQDEIARVTEERNGWMQDLFETNRHAAFLTQERQHLLEEKGALTSSAAYFEDLWRNSEQWGKALEAKVLEQNAVLHRPAPPVAETSSPRDDAAATEARLQMEARLQQALRERDDSQAWLDAVRRSTSWRVTRPVRVLMRLMRNDRR